MNIVNLLILSNTNIHNSHTPIFGEPQMISRHHVPHRKTAPWETKQGHSRDHHQPERVNELPRDSFTTKTADKNLIKPTKTCILLTQIGTYSIQNWVNFGLANYHAESWYAIPTYCKVTPDPPKPHPCRVSNKRRKRKSRCNTLQRWR